jgi:hypothetical protein
MGKVVLCIEGPLMSRRFAKLAYDITGPGGTPVEGRPVLFRAKTTGFTKATMDLRIYAITQPGRHVLQIQGLGEEQPSDAEHRMVFTRPHLARTMAYVLGIVFAAVFTIGSLVLFLLRLANVKGT